MDIPALDLILKTSRNEQEIQDFLRQCEEDGQILIEQVPDSVHSGTPYPKMKLLGQILVERGDVKREELVQPLNEQKPLGEKLVEAGVVSQEKVDAALAEQRRQKDVYEKRFRTDTMSSIRVSSLKLDMLVNLIGELVTVQERLSQVTSSLRETRMEDAVNVLQKFDLNAISEEVSRLTAGLRDNTLSIRMLPIEATFSKFKRLVHDLSADLGKEVELTTSGSETEIDKTVIDKLDEPLMHLIRNSIDHGIEAPETREAAGKPRKGTIHLSAEHSGGNVVIHVRDDGAGLRQEAILAKAVEKKLVQPNTPLSEKEIYALIFLPGFSTAERVTNVSGRGVGMDVVKKTIEDLRGNLDVSSTIGQGTCMDLTLPLTLAIIDGLLVNIAGQPFILPLSAVEECVELKRDVGDSLAERQMATVRGALIPYIPLRERFGIAGEHPEIEQIVISNVKEQKIGFTVDSVIGEHKTVIKPLGKMYRNVPEFSGATILGDGSVAIILDLAKLIDTTPSL
jgi:two-component system chemotaxis sensor kinase CheA